MLLNDWQCLLQNTWKHWNKREYRHKIGQDGAEDNGKATDSRNYVWFVICFFVVVVVFNFDHPG